MGKKGAGVNATLHGATSTYGTFLHKRYFAVKLCKIGRKELTRRTASRILSLLTIATLMFSSLGYFAPAASASSHPRNGGEAWGAGFRGIVEPQNPIVLQQLHNLCPTIDEEHFTVNFLSVYTYSMLVPYAYDSDVYGVIDYWQTSEETISLGHGDCEDQAINLVTLIEALYKETYGYIPSNLVWVVTGHIVVPGQEGDHAWILVNEGALPKETIEEIKSVSISEAIINIILGGYAVIQDLYTQKRLEIEARLDLSTLPSKNNQQLSLLYSGERYFELEPTWNLPVSEYYFKKYPYTKVYAIFNSQGYELDPDFYPVEQPPYMGAEIKNIAFPLRVIVGNTLTVNITVQNYDCGNLGADLVLILKDYGVEVTRKNAYVFKYWWQIQTFVFNLQAVEPAQTEELSVELFWHNYWPPFIDDWILEDFKNFTMQTISNKPDLVPYSGFTYPGSASEGQLLVFNVLGQNLGPMSAGSYAIDIFIDEVPFDRVTVAGCAGFSGFQTQTKPWVATAGTHYLRAIVDATNTVLEYNETNNEIIVNFEVRAQLQYRKSHVIASSLGADIDYQVMIVVHYGSGTDYGQNVYCNYHCQTDFDDVRFTDSTGDVPLCYWRGPKIDGDYAVFWVKIQGNLTASAQKIYVCYGNPAVSTTSSFNSTFIFGDPFDDPILDSERWSSLTGNPTYVIDTTNHYLEVTDMDGFHWFDGAGFQSRSFTMPSSWIVQDAYTSNGLRIFHNPDQVSNIFGQRFLLRNSTGDVASLDLHDAWAQDSNIAEFAYISNDNWSRRDVTVPLPYSTYWIMKKSNNDNITMAQDGTDRIVKSSSWTIDRILWEISSYQSYGFGTERLYAFMIRKYVDPEPEHGIWGYEELLLHDIALTNVRSNKTCVGNGQSIFVSVSIVNQGNYTESFRLTINANALVLVSWLCFLEPNRTLSIFFAWNTTSYNNGNYTLSAVVDAIPGEIDVGDNSFVLAGIHVGLLGDVNGDGKVDVKDAYKVALAYGTSSEGPNPPGRTYNPNCDINGDEKVDVKDYYIVCRHYGEVDP